MHIHILGICGTFMGGVAALAKSLGHEVTGSDANVYPPMSTQLEQLGISLNEGYAPEHLQPEPDLVVVGNAVSRGNPAVEYVLDKQLPYVSGPQWLCEYLLQERWCLAVAGTHGKTTTASMLAWILEFAGMSPGYLIGGVPGNFDVSARLGDTPFFVVEADEYDSAFFDKRSKFVHYRPRTLILNNLEFDHADIFEDLGAIQKQFHHLVRTVPGQGRILAPAEDKALQQVLEMGCWTPLEQSGKEWQVISHAQDGSCFEVVLNGESQGTVNWRVIGQHNVQNGLMAIAAARHVGVTPAHAIEALCEFRPPKRRMETIAESNGITVYDDFAHHPTAIATTLAGLKARIGEGERVLAVLEPRSNTMKMGVHQQQLADSLAEADKLFLFQPDNISWSLEQMLADAKMPGVVTDSIDLLLRDVLDEAQPGDHILIMSNGGFSGFHRMLKEALV